GIHGFYLCLEDPDGHSQGQTGSDLFHFCTQRLRILSGPAVCHADEVERLQSSLPSARERFWQGRRTEFFERHTDPMGFSQQQCDLFVGKAYSRYQEYLSR